MKVLTTITLRGSNKLLWVGSIRSPDALPRMALFAAALPAAFRWNKALIDLYTRLKAKGKAHNAALVACARKLLIYANTVVQRGTPWTERPVHV